MENHIDPKALIHYPENILILQLQNDGYDGD